MPDTDDKTDAPSPDRKHPRRLSAPAYHAPHQLVFITVRARAGVDLNRPEIVAPLLSSLSDTAAARDLAVHAYCLMPDHLHLVVSVEREGGDAAAWVRFMKREAAKRTRLRGIWQRSFWDRHARDSDDVAGMVSYVLANPVRKGLCDSWEDWPFSWSRWHRG
jgi:putative transposase